MGKSSVECANLLGLLVGFLTVRRGASVSKSGLIGSWKIPSTKVKLSAKLDRTGSNVPFRVD